MRSERQIIQSVGTFGDTRILTKIYISNTKTKHISKTRVQRVMVT